jgi:hypothetical protein
MVHKLNLSLLSVRSLALGLPALLLVLAGCPGTDPGVVPDDSQDAGIDVVMPPKTDASVKDAAKDTGAVVDPDFANKPELTAMNPQSATVGSVGPSVILSGKNFVPRSVVQLGGAELTTSYVSPTELRATIPTSRLVATGSLTVTVGTSLPGGGTSKSLAFEVVNPAPVLTAIASPVPASVPVGTPGVTITVTGRDFVAGASLWFDGLALSTTVTSTTSLTATVPAGKLVASGTFTVVVKNPAPGGGTSSPIAFVVSNPTVQLNTLTPSWSLIGAADLPVMLGGNGFVSASTVSFNGTPLAGATVVSGTQLGVTIPSALMTTVGNFPVVVTNPAPGGGVTVPLVFQVRYPAPSALSISPDSASSGAAPTSVTVTGSEFYPASQITFNGAPAATTYLSPTQVRATLSAAQIAAPGAIAVRVVNPAPGGGTSTGLTFQVSNPAPSLASVTPVRPLYVGGVADTSLTLAGLGFVSTSQVYANASLLLTSFVSATQLSATLPASALSQPGSLAFTVVSPAPGGGTSNVVRLNLSCDPTGVEVQLTTLNAPVTLNTNFKLTSTPKQVKFGSAGVCPMAVSAVSQPYRAVVVQNNTISPATLSSWAVCQVVRNATNVITSQDDALLTYYRGGTVPSTIFEREPCTPVVSEGFSAAGAYASPEGSGANYCPGLTKANGGGIVLGACAKAVVFMQPYDVADTMFTPPATMKVSLE